MGLTVSGLPAAVEAAILSAFAGARERLAPGDIAVVGVTCPTGGALHELGQDGWNDMVASLREATFAIQEAAREMASASSPVSADGPSRGRIVVVVPAHSIRTSAGTGVAAVAGSFLTTVAQVAAVELAPKGIRVNVVAAGPLEGAAPASVVAGVPVGRLTRPEDVAGACVLLALPESEHMNGAVVAVDGGYAVTKAGGGSPFAVQ